MSAQRLALSLLFVWHVFAIALGSLESPGAVVPVGPPRRPTSDVIAASVTPVLDIAAAAVSPGADVLNRAPLSLRQLVGNYLSLTGVSQSWKMFSNPPQVHQYLRARHYVGSVEDLGSAAPRSVWTATELMLPAHREDEVRLFRGYWDAFRDKAMTSALARFHERRGLDLIRPDTKSQELPDDLAPVLRYFARRFARIALRPDERILRSEVWYGTAPMRAAGASVEPGRQEARGLVLREYYQGPVEDHFSRIGYPDYHVAQRQADIEWVLEYFEP